MSITMKRKLTLIRRRSIQHAKDLQDVAIAIITMKLIPCAIKAQDQLSGLTSATARLLFIRHCCSRPGRVVGREIFLVRVNSRLEIHAPSSRTRFATVWRQVKLIHRVQLLHCSGKVVKVVVRRGDTIRCESAGHLSRQLWREHFLGPSPFNMGTGYDGTRRVTSASCKLPSSLSTRIDPNPAADNHLLVKQESLISWPSAER